jgi:hypothetical protein
MATTVFFRSANGPLHRGDLSINLAGGGVGAVVQSLATTRGAGLVTHTANTVAGPTNGVEIDDGSSNDIEWISEPLDADVTISGTITVNLWASENNMSANVAINCIIERLDSQGAIISTIAQTTRTTELAVTTNAVNNFTVTPTSTNMLKGDRLRIRVYGDDSTANMASGFTFSFGYNGNTASANGDSFVTFNETFGFLTTAASGTQLFLTDVAGPSVSGFIEKEMWSSRGDGVNSFVVDTASGWTAPIQWTNSTTADTKVEWYSKRLSAFTLADIVNVNIRALTSNVITSGSLRAELAVCNDDGSNVTIWAAATYNHTTVGGDIPTTETVCAFHLSGDDLAVAAGQRLRLRVYIDDASDSPLAGSQTATMFYDGTTGGASGDSWIQLTQSVTEYTPDITTGLSTETDTAITVAAEKQLSTGNSLETDTALSVAAEKQLSTGNSLETNSAITVTLERILDTGLSSETNTALALTLESFPVVASDDFNRANSSLNGATASDGISVWTNSGTFNVASNMATSAGNSARSFIDASVSDVDVSVTIATAGGSGANRLGPLLRWVDSSNYIFVRGNGTSYELHKVVATTDTAIATALGTVAAGDRLRLNAIGDQLRLYLTPSGGSESLLTGPHTVTDHQSATKHGIYSAFSSDSLDDFTIVDLSSGSTIATGLASETDSALTTTVEKQATPGIAVETDSALTLSIDKQLTTGLAAETDSALTIALEKNVAIVLATETDSALTVTVDKNVAVAFSSETDSALASSLTKELSVAVAAEVDTALAPSLAGGPIQIPTGMASETDSSFAVGIEKQLSTGNSLETDTALTVTVDRTVNTGLSSETDTASAVTFQKDLGLGIAAETDTALALALQGSFSVGIASETDTALPLSVVKEVSVGLSSEVDTALNLAFQHTLSTAFATETDTTLSLFLTKECNVGLAVETDTALALVLGDGTINISVGMAIEIDEAREVFFEDIDAGVPQTPVIIKYNNRTFGRGYRDITPIMGQIEEN